MAKPSGSARNPSGDIWRGTLVGKYELLTQLSMGGMSEQFLAYTPGPGGFRKYVVLKRILPDAKDNEQFVRMFLDEARITAAFSHSNIVQVFDLGEDGDGLYLAMEFIAGQNLNQVTNACARQQAVMPLGFSASVVHDCALALHYAHTFKDPTGKDFPVIHRDVAQKNIMVTYDGQVKLLDFGIAKARGALGKTHAGAVKGTAGYMSPEQVRGEPLDGRSDVFALGVVLYEMITGRRLFSAATEIEEMQMILEAPIARPSEVFAVIPEELSDVAMRALAREKADRFATAKEVSRALQGACAHLLFDQEQRATFMRELFEEKMLATQTLLESAGSDIDRPQLIDQAAKAMQEEAQAAPTQKIAKKLPRATLDTEKKKKVKKEAAKEVDEKLVAVKVKAEALGDASPPPKEQGGVLIPLLLLIGIGGLVVGAYKVVLGGDQTPPAVPAYQADVPIPQFGQGGAGGAAAPTDPPPKPDPADPRAPDKNPNAAATEKEDGRGKKTAPAGKGQLTLFTIPGGAQVLKGKADLGKTPLVNHPLPAGTHLLQLVFPDGKKKKLSVPVEPNKTVKLKLTRDELPDW